MKTIKELEMRVIPAITPEKTEGLYSCYLRVTYPNGVSVEYKKQEKITLLSDDEPLAEGNLSCIMNSLISFLEQLRNTDDN